MIFYFSGTGNSFYVAETVANHNNEKLISIASIRNRNSSYEFTLQENEAIGFVFPVHSYAPPGIVLEFIKKLKFKTYYGNYVFAVATCAENIGDTMKVLDKQLMRKGLKLDSAFSLVMPNNYIINRDVNSAEQMQMKLEVAEIGLDMINSMVNLRRKNVFSLDKGIFPFFKTIFANPVLNFKMVKPYRFYVQAQCNGCGVCSEVCNCNNITMNNTPHWGNKCSHCLACINYCPVNAIQYGKASKAKGRYHNPNVKTGQMFTWLKRI